MTVRCKFHGWEGVVIGFTTEARPIVQWLDGPDQSRSWADLEAFA